MSSTGFSSANIDLMNEDYEEGTNLLKTNKPFVDQKTFNRALLLIRKAAEKRYSPARRVISGLLLLGGGYGFCIPDYVELISDYRREAFQWAFSIIKEDERATSEDHDNSAMMYENGWGTTKNLEYALMYTEQAADPHRDESGEDGWPDAQYRLAWMKKVGWGKVKLDQAKANKWYEIARQNRQNEKPLSMSLDDYVSRFVSALESKKSSSAAVYLAFFYETGQVSPKDGKDPKQVALSYYMQAKDLGEGQNIEERMND